MPATSKAEIADSPNPVGSAQETWIVVASSASNGPSLLREIWRYRTLLYFLTWRDIKVRYKRTVMGLAWAIVQPLFVALTVSFFLGRLAKMPSDGLPYAVFVFAAMVPWQLFAHSVTSAGNSLIANERLITKVYFPRILAPMSAVAGCLVDFLFAFLVLLVFVGYYHVQHQLPSYGASFLALLTLPAFVLLAVIISLGAGLWLAALNVQFRDVRYTVGFLVQLCFFATPIAYSSSVVPIRWRTWYALNPLVGVIDGFRWSLLGVGEFPFRVVLASLLGAIVLFSSGLYYFRRMEESIADVI